jgi:hypothetical protein
METTTVQYRETSVPSPTRRFSNKNLMLFFISFAVMIALLIFIPQFFWLVLPFVCTYLVTAFDAL